MNVTTSPKTKTEQDCLRYGKTGSFQLDDFIAGWVGGAAGVIVGHPLDTVKTRLQAGQGYGNTLNCIRTIYKKEAVTGFFKGMSFPLISIAAYNSLVFGVFSSTQRFICQHRYGKPNHPPALTDITLASIVTGAFSVGIGCPVDLVKIRLQMQTQTFPKATLEMKHKATGISVQAAYRGPIHCIATILQQEGLPGLFRGTTAMLLRDVPGYCLYFIPYALVSAWLTAEECLSPTPFAAWMAGGIAGIISWGTATPMDVVKCRLQADGVYVNKYKGVIDCIYQSYHTEGLKMYCNKLESKQDSTSHIRSEANPKMGQNIDKESYLRKLNFMKSEYCSDNLSLKTTALDCPILKKIGTLEELVIAELIKGKYR